MKQIDFAFFDAGGGHRAAATALKASIAASGKPWNVRLVNIQEILEPLDIFNRITGVRMQDVYNQMLKKGWTLGSTSMVKAMHALIRLYHPDQVRVLREYWAKSQPDLVVSLIPNFGRALYQSLSESRPGTPLVTILTDFADYPPHFWMEPQQNQHYICGTEKALEQARQMGYGPDRTFLVSGMILHPRFYEDVAVDRDEARRKIGLRPDLPTGLILFGGQGSTVMQTILERVESAGIPSQFIAVCGKNAELRQSIEARNWKMPVCVEGFTTEIPYYMRLSDFFIGKPGPGSISEAMRMHLPVILERNAWTLPQERYNADWVKEKQVGRVLNNFTDIAPCLSELLANGHLEELRANTGKLDNQAVFEIPPLLEALMER